MKKLLNIGDTNLIDRSSSSESAKSSLKDAKKTANEAGLFGSKDDTMTASGMLLRHQKIATEGLPQRLNSVSMASLLDNLERNSNSVKSDLIKVAEAKTETKEEVKGAETSEISEDLVTPSMLETILSELRNEIEETNKTNLKQLLEKIEVELAPFREG